MLTVGIITGSSVCPENRCALAKKKKKKNASQIWEMQKETVRETKRERERKQLQNLLGE